MNPKYIIKFMRLNLLKFIFLKYFYSKILFNNFLYLKNLEKNNIDIAILVHKKNVEEKEKEEVTSKIENFNNLIIFELGNLVLIYFIMSLLLGFKLKFLISFLLNKIKLIYFFEVYKLYIFDYKLQNIFSIYKRSKNNNMIYFKIKYNKFLFRNFSFFNTKIIQLKILTIFDLLSNFNYFFITLYKYSNNYFGVYNKKKYLLFLLVYFKKINSLFKRFKLFSKEFKKFNIFNKINRLRFRYLSTIIFFF